MVESAVIAICGVPGVGKTTVAEMFQEQLQCERLRTDEIRQAVVEEPEYTEEERKKVYNEMFARIHTLIVEDGVVVLDGTFTEQERRNELYNVVSDARVVFIKVECDEKRVIERIRERNGISDADESVYRELREKFHPIDSDYTIDNSYTKAQTQRQVAQIIEELQ